MMKKIALSLVTLSSILVLTACGSHNKATTDQSSSVTKTSKTSSSSKASSKKKTSSTKESQFSEKKEESSSTVASSAVANKENEKQTEQAKTETPATPVPAEVVGTWTASNAQAKSVSMTIGADGSISVEANYGVGDDDDIRHFTANGTAMEVKPGLYRWVRNGGDTTAFLAGVTGLGGANFKAEEGFLLEGNQYTPVWFTAPLDQDFDYANNYNAFSNNTLTKQ